jgi:hypothetical protein
MKGRAMNMVTQPKPQTLMLNQPRSGVIYQAYIPGTPEELARNLFRKKYFTEPAEVFSFGNMLWVGPVPVQHGKANS